MSQSQLVATTVTNLRTVLPKVEHYNQTLQLCLLWCNELVEKTLESTTKQKQVLTCSYRWITTTHFVSAMNMWLNDLLPTDNRTWRSTSSLRETGRGRPPDWPNKMKIGCCSLPDTVDINIIPGSEDNSSSVLCSTSSDALLRTWVKKRWATADPGSESTCHRKDYDRPLWGASYLYGSQIS